MTIPFSALPPEIAKTITKHWMSPKQVLKTSNPSFLKLLSPGRRGFFRPRHYMINKWALNYACELYGRTNMVTLRGGIGQQSFMNSIERSVFYRTNEVLPLHYIEYLQLPLPINMESRYAEDHSEPKFKLPFNRDLDLELPPAIAFIQQQVPHLKTLVLTTDLTSNIDCLKPLFSLLKHTSTTFELHFHSPSLRLGGTQQSSSEYWTSSLKWMAVRASQDTKIKIVRVLTENDANPSKSGIPCLCLACPELLLTAPPTSAVHCSDCDLVLFCSIDCRDEQMDEI